MKYYFAPMEGVTTAIYRRTHAELFPGCDRYYAPFLVACQSQVFRPRELRRLAPEENPGLVLIPQLLGNDASRSSPRRRCCGTWALMR
jgi:tRNA-dihydrouridine synthase